MKEQQAITPMGALINSRMEALGLDDESLGRRLGYRRAEKAKGRVDALVEGFVTSQRSRRALAKLGAALDVSQDVVDAAVRDTLAQQAAEEEARQERVLQALREVFRPGALIDTTLRVPSQITLCGVTGGPERYRSLPIDTSQREETWSTQALHALEQKTIATPDGRRLVAFFGEAKGVVVNYAVDRAERYDLDGRLVEAMRRCELLGRVRVRA